MSSSVIGGSSSNSIGSVGQVLGAATAAAAGADLLPRTGLGSWVFFLAIFSMAAAAIVLLSFIVTRIVRFFVTK